MIVPKQIGYHKNSQLIAVSRHQQVWKIGWTRVPSYQVTSSSGYASFQGPHGFYTTKYGSTCNYVRMLHDGRILEAWAYPKEPDNIYASQWPVGFYYCIAGIPENEKQTEREKLHIQRELVEQLIGVIKYGQEQARLMPELLHRIGKERLTRPESGLALLFQIWKPTY